MFAASLIASCESGRLAAYASAGCSVFGTGAGFLRPAITNAPTTTITISAATPHAARGRPPRCSSSGVKIGLSPPGPLGPSLRAASTDGSCSSLISGDSIPLNNIRRRITRKKSLLTRKQHFHRDSPGLLSYRRHPNLPGKLAEKGHLPLFERHWEPPHDRPSRRLHRYPHSCTPASTLEHSRSSPLRRAFRAPNHPLRDASGRCSPAFARRQHPLWRTPELPAARHRRSPAAPPSSRRHRLQIGRAHV